MCTYAYVHSDIHAYTSAHMERGSLDAPFTRKHYDIQNSMIYIHAHTVPWRQTLTYTHRQTVRWALLQYEHLAVHFTHKQHIHTQTVVFDKNTHTCVQTRTPPPPHQQHWDSIHTCAYTHVHTYTHAWNPLLPVQASSVEHAYLCAHRVIYTVAQISLACMRFWMYTCVHMYAYMTHTHLWPSSSLNAESLCTHILSLSLAYTHKQQYTHTHTHAHTHYQTHTHIYIYIYTYIYI